MIKSFKDKRTEQVAHRVRVPKFGLDLQKQAARKLRAVNLAENLSDLRTPPGNRLEALRSDREGQHSIRINDQWRICFTWKDGHAYDVEITDYH